MTTQRPMRFNNCDYNGLAHEWVYNHERDLRTGCDRMHTRGNTCYSYSTAIAYKIVDRRILLIAREGFSNTTRKQKGRLESAFSFWNIIEVSADNIPEQDEFLDSYIKRELRECLDTMQYLLDNCKKNKQGILVRASDRETFVDRCRTIRKWCAYADWEITDELFNKYADYSEYSEKLYEYDMARRERLEQTRVERERRAAEERIKRNEELQAALYEFNQSGSKSYKKYSAILEKYNISCYFRKQMIESFFGLNTLQDYKENYSYIWRADDVVKTTQYITVPWRDVELLLKLWKAGKPILGKTAGQYTVLSVNDKYVQVGCHKIPAANLNAVYEEEICDE